jgi:hypothetical protein
VRKVSHRWKKISFVTPERISIQLKNHWYSVLAKREQEYLPDLEKMMRIRSAVRKNEFVKEITERIESGLNITR